MVQHINEGKAVIDAWKKSGKTMQGGSQRISSASFQEAKRMVQAVDIGTINYIESNNDRFNAIGAWNYSVPPDASLTTLDWDRFLGHRVEFAGRPVGPSPKELPFDRAAFAQWRCLREFSGGPLSDLLAHPVTHLVAALGVREPARVTAGGGIVLEADGRSVPDVATVVADFDEGLQLVATAATVTGFPTDELVRGRLGALGAENPDLLCVPSQKGLMPDFPHRHSAMVCRPGSISAPS